GGERDGFAGDGVGFGVESAAGEHLRLYQAALHLGRDVVAVTELTPLPRPLLRLVEPAQRVEGIGVTARPRCQPGAFPPLLQDAPPPLPLCRRRCGIAGEQFERDRVLREIRAEYQDVASLLERLLEL